MIRFGKGGERLVPVKLGARLTETGTLETWCDSKISENRWRLQFQIRKAAPRRHGPRQTSRRRQPGSSGSRVRTGARDVRTGAGTDRRPKNFLRASKPHSVSAATPGRWKSRADSPTFSSNRSRIASRSAAHEVRWLNLGGFCLRPGFGYIGDEYRIEQVRRIYAAGPQFGNQAQNEIDWWIFWGRLAGGLNRNQQADIVQRLLPFLLPQAGQETAARSTTACCAKCGARLPAWN